VSSQLRLIPVPIGPVCNDCLLLRICGSERNSNACPAKLDLRGPAGPYYLHPDRFDFEDQLAFVGGVDFDDIAGRPVGRLGLPVYLPQVRWRRSIAAEQIRAKEMSFVAVRIADVFRGGRIRTAAELREHVGLPPIVQLVLLLHGRDEHLEAFSAVDLAAAIAAAGYLLVTPPSFSLWEPRRRPNNILSLRRRAVSYGELTDAGAKVCPQVGWVEPIDVERLASWINSFGGDIVALDLMTYSAPSFERAVEGLAYFDALTGEQMHYLVDGVATTDRIAMLYLATSAERVTVSSATIGPPPKKFDGAKTLRERTAVMDSRCAEARALAEAADENSAEEFVRHVLARSNSIDSLAA
jgi:hypothetical protein